MILQSGDVVTIGLLQSIPLLRSVSIHHLGFFLATEYLAEWSLLKYGHITLLSSRYRIGSSLHVPDSMRLFGTNLNHIFSTALLGHYTGTIIQTLITYKVYVCCVLTVSL